jgi:hypothetical protein
MHSSVVARLKQREPITGKKFQKYIKTAAPHLERCPCAVFFDNFADFARLKKPAVGAGGREGSKTTLGQCRRR